jgi:hypothetical protein
MRHTPAIAKAQLPIGQGLELERAGGGDSSRRDRGRVSKPYCMASPFI